MAEFLKDYLQSVFWKVYQYFSCRVVLGQREFNNVQLVISENGPVKSSSQHQHKKEQPPTPTSKGGYSDRKRLK